MSVHLANKRVGNTTAYCGKVKEQRYKLSCGVMRPVVACIECTDTYSAPGAVQLCDKSETHTVQNAVIQSKGAADGPRVRNVPSMGFATLIGSRVRDRSA
jgi:hypothetical protein